MSRLLKIVVLFLALEVFSYANGADSVNLLIMIDDADKNSVSRDSQINKRVHASISQQLNQVADVYDETSLTLDTFKQGRGRRTDAELLDIARSINRPPVDIVVVLSTYASVTTSEYAKKARARVEGKILPSQGNFWITLKCKAHERGQSHTLVTGKLVCLKKWVMKPKY